MAISRNKENFIIMTVIYNELLDADSSNLFENTPRDFRFLAKSLISDENEILSPYLENVIFLSLTNYQEIVKKISPFLKGWTWERLPYITRAILLMSYSRRCLLKNSIPKGVVIDGAVKLSKAYTDDKQAKFINAVLDEVLP